MKKISLLCVSIMVGQILINNGAVVADTTFTESQIENTENPATPTSEVDLPVAQKTTESTSTSLVNEPDPSTSSVSQVNTMEGMTAETNTIPSIEATPKTTAPAPKSIINSDWGTCPVTFDDTTGILTIMAGNLGTAYQFPSSIIPLSNVKEIVIEPGVIAPTDSSNLFGLLINVVSIEGPLDTSNVTNMSQMFLGLNYLKSVDVSTFDTSKVTDMSYMFSSCYQLSNLDVSNFDTSNVTNMQNMFEGDGNITSLDLSNFNTSQVTNMAMMFTATGISNLDLSNFNTSKVTNMYFMFRWCSALQTLNLNSFDTSKVTDMQYMFESDTNLNTLILGKDTVFNPTTELPVIDTTSGQYSGGWERVSPVTPSSVYQSSDLFMTNYDGSAPGTYVWQTTKAAVVAKDSTLHVGDTWKAEDNFISATDAFGNPLSFSDVTVTGTVDTSKAGVYPITYTNGSVNQTINVTVLDKADLSTIKAKDSTLHVGDTWKAEDNFISATDPSGTPLSFSDVTVTGTVDTSKAGVYPITYTNGSVSQTINVTVLDKVTTPFSNSKPSNTSTLTAEKVENKELPKTGDSNSSWLISMLGMMLIIVLGVISAFSYKKKKLK